MSYYEGGDLAQRLKERSVFDENEVAQICSSLALFLFQCHGRGLMHRCLTLDNILLKSKESSSDICVTDFGYCVFYHTGSFNLKCW